MRRWFVLATVCVVALGALLPAPRASADSAFSVNAKLTFLGPSPNGEQRYRYDYTVTNNAIDLGVTAFQVFFNSDPVSPYPPSGDKATYVAHDILSGWEVTVMPKDVTTGQWSIAWDDVTAPPIALGDSLLGFAVVFDWNDPNSTPPVQHVQARNGDPHSGVSVVPPSSIAGTVTGTCGGSAVGLQGITVDLFVQDAQGQETFLASTATEATGHFEFSNLQLGTYDVVIVTPLGYLADANSKTVAVIESGIGYGVDFALTCQAIAAQPRTIGYWKHQVNVYLTGKGSAQESLSAMLGYIGLILTHFNQNITNPVLIYVPASGDTTDELLKLQQLLTVNQNGTMLDRAKQQLLALLLNVVSGKIAQTQVISPNGATVSQAITYCKDLIQDPLSSNDESAKTIADLINNGQTVPSGMVPASTRIITYSRTPVAGEVVEFRLDAASPNPSRGAAVTIGFALARADRVELRLYDVSGRTVRTLASGSFGAGPHRLTWDGTDGSGARVQPGVYFYRLATEEGTLTRSVTLQR